MENPKQKEIWNFQKVSRGKQQDLGFKRTWSRGITV